MTGAQTDPNVGAVILVADGPSARDLSWKQICARMIERHGGEGWPDAVSLGVNVAGLKYPVDFLAHYDAWESRAATAGKYQLSAYNAAAVDLGPSFWNQWIRQRRRETGRAFLRPYLTLPLALEWALVTWPNATAHLFGIDHGGIGLAGVGYKESHWQTERRLLAEFLPPHMGRIVNHGKANLEMVGA